VMAKRVDTLVREKLGLNRNKVSLIEI